MLLVTADGRIAAVNQQIERLLGYAPAEVVGQPVEVLLPLPDRATHAEHVARWFQTPKARGLGSGIELRALHRSGQVLDVDISLSPLATEEGRKAVVVIRDASARRAHERDLAWRATHDPLTGLANRTMVLDHLRMALLRGRRHPASVGVLYVDLDQFKAVNDQFGHDAGDGVLRVAAEAIRRGVRGGDVVGRVGGDEFVVVCVDLQGLRSLEAIADRVQQTVRAATVRLGDSPAQVACSIGLVMAQESEVDPEQVLRRADAAMYAAKSGHQAAQCATPPFGDMS